MYTFIQVAMAHAMHANSVSITREVAAESNLAQRSAVPERCRLERNAAIVLLLTNKPRTCQHKIRAGQCEMHRDSVAGKVDVASGDVVSTGLVWKYRVAGNRLIGALRSRHFRARNRSFAPRSNLIAKVRSMPFKLRPLGVELQDQLMAIRQGRGEMDWSTAHRASSCNAGPSPLQTVRVCSPLSTQEDTGWFETRSLSGSQISVPIT